MTRGARFSLRQSLLCKVRLAVSATLFLHRAQFFSYAAIRITLLIEEHYPIFFQFGKRQW